MFKIPLPRPPLHLLTSFVSFLRKELLKKLQQELFWSLWPQQKIFIFLQFYSFLCLCSTWSWSKNKPDIQKIEEWSKKKLNSPFLLVATILFFLKFPFFMGIMERTRYIASKNAAIGGNTIKLQQKRNNKKYNQKDINNHGLKFNYCRVWPFRWFRVMDLQWSQWSCEFVVFGVSAIIIL